MRRHEFGWGLPETVPMLMIEASSLREALGYKLREHTEENLWKLRKMGYEVLLFHFGAGNPFLFTGCVYANMRRFTTTQLKDWLRFHEEVEYVFMKKSPKKGQPIAQEKYREFKSWNELFRVLKDVKEK